ncbi:MAG: hypothetical protein AAB152_00130 [Candidatus Coatesbacteria bacterium]
MRLLWTLALVPALAAAGTSPINVLNKVEPTRTQSIGGAGVAIGVDPTLVWINPAAAVHCDGASLTMEGQQGFFRETTGQALWATPLRGGVVFAGALYYDAGTAKIADSTGALRSYDLQQDFAGMIGYAAPISKTVSSGVTLQWLRSELFNRSSSSLNGDGGVQIAISRYLKVGFALQHVGTKLTYLNHDIDLPTTARVGVALGMRPAELLPFMGSKDTLVAVLDAVQPVVEKKAYWKTGIEYRWQRLIALRAGANGGGRVELSNYAAGFGLRFGRFRLDYGIRFGHAFSNPQTLSLTVALPSLGASAPAPAASLSPAAPGPSAPPQYGGPTLPVEPEELALPTEPEPTGTPETTQVAPPPVPPAPRSDEGGLIDDLNRQLDELIHKGSSGK